MKKLFFIAASFLVFSNLYASNDPQGWNTPDWSPEAKIPTEGHRANIFQLEDKEWKVAIERGQVHASVWPIEDTGVLLPLIPIEKLFAGDTKNPIRNQISKTFKKVLGLNSMPELYEWLGLAPYPKEDATGIYKIAYPNGKRPDYPMGLGKIKTSHGMGATFSCTACHASSLFGKTVFGLPNKKLRGAQFYHFGKKYVKFATKSLFMASVEHDKNDLIMFLNLKKGLNAAGTRASAARGLDTPMAQVSAGLAVRDNSPDALILPELVAHPKMDPLKEKNATVDTKPATWWNVKYKTRFLHDGSLEGNPVPQNIIWNEIARATSMPKLEEWFKNNKLIVRDLTAAVFAARPPRFTDFFPAKKISLLKAKEGEVIFNNRCAKCHGHYDKAWNTPHANSLNEVEILETVKVRYHETTPVKDVGTDKARHESMVVIAGPVNDLNVSKVTGTKLVPQVGYVPPPLVGVWARWPYFHNNSAPTLCAVLTPHKKRPKEYWAGAPIDKEIDFDSECNGYPLGSKVPEMWKKDKFFHFDTTKPGLENMGHEKMFMQDGKEILSSGEKMALIQFLQTL